MMERALAAWFLLAIAPATTATPTEVVQTALEQTTRVVQEAEAAPPASPAPRRVQFRRIAEGLFDFQEMARRSLAQHWTERTAPQRAEFVRLMTDLLERAYFGRIQNLSGDQIIFTGESVDGNYATVRSKVITTKKTEVPLEYRLHLVGSRWAVYDIMIDGVSFVSTYRSQFQRIIQTSSYEGLLQKLRQKSLEVAIPERNGASQN